jgi:hypothetical protein
VKPLLSWGNEILASDDSPTQLNTSLALGHSGQPYRREVLSRLFAHEVVRPSSPVCGFLCVRHDYTHPMYPGLRWLPGSEHPGHFVLSTQPLGSLAWLEPSERLAARVVECALVPQSIIGGGHDTVEAQRVVVSAERTKPLGPHTQSLREFWGGIRSDAETPSRQAALELASEALLRFRLYGRFACRGVSFVKFTGSKSGWSPGINGADSGWAQAWTTALAELKRLSLGVLNESEWAMASDGIGQLVRSRLPALPRHELLSAHILYTSYAIASGPASARLNPFAPLVNLALMGLPALGVVGNWFRLGTRDDLPTGRYPLRGRFFEDSGLPIAGCGR